MQTGDGGDKMGTDSTSRLRIDSIKLQKQKKKGGVSQALQNDGDDEVTENVDAGKTAARKPVKDG
ncbi:hypothetical protein J6TS7_61610 [Paenibacillus dendritiformis]|nr:hypothetical protein J6TS7_61610 [Paenibacillus dendritiformis]